MLEGKSCFAHSHSWKTFHLECKTEFCDTVLEKYYNGKKNLSLRVVYEEIHLGAY